MTRRRALLALLLLAVACSTTAIVLVSTRSSSLWQVVIDQVDKPATQEAGLVTFSVRDGDSAATIGKRLEEQGLIQNALAFRYLASYYGVAADLKSGDYELSANMKPSDILARLNHGLVKTVDVTILEGWRVEQMAAELDKNGIFAKEDFLKAATGSGGDYAFLREKPAGSSLEGYLFPDTYRISPKTQAADFVRLMLDNFDRQFTNEMRQEAAAEGLSTHEVVTLASIVEREAMMPDERPVIARVFLNRLAKGMPLQADPTVQYAVAGDPASVLKFGYWKRDLTVEDLATNSPYNTYVQRGLPPGPIANPGLSSLKAVLEPNQNDFLYFVAKNDGSHAFAKTLEEHNANVRRYGN